MTDRPAELPGYSGPYTHCDKCGNRRATTRHRAGDDTLRRRCRRCGFTWSEAPLNLTPDEELPRDAPATRWAVMVRDDDTDQWTDRRWCNDLEAAERLYAETAAYRDPDRVRLLRIATTATDIPVRVVANPQVVNR